MNRSIYRPMVHCFAVKLATFQCLH